MIPGHGNFRFGGVLCLALFACVQAHAAHSLPTGYRPMFSCG
jgi:hypothetical protein